MSYNTFAYHYDLMMVDVDYSAWLEIIKKQIKKGGRILDVGCGTGTLSFALAEIGYDVTGLDLSSDMLAVAFEKMQNQKQYIQLLERDMRDLSGFADFDCVLIAIDSLNYLRDAEEVKLTFDGSYKALNSGGVIVFDVHTPKKMTDTFADYLYVENTDELSYIWHVEEDEEPLSVVHELTIFTKNEDGTYNRNIEHHHQRTFDQSDYEQWLIGTGFTILSITGDDERVFFVARKDGA